MTIEDIKFEPHYLIPGGIQGQLVLANGIIVSVVAGRGLYGDGVDTFEVAAWRMPRKHIHLGEHDEVLGWQTREDVNAIIRRLGEMEA